MRIVVFDIPAESSGALTILREFYDHVCERSDKDVYWTFVVSTDKLQDRHVKNVEIRRYPEAKASILSRLRFESVDAPALVKSLGADVLLSLQNLAVIRTRVPQVLYVHQSLPYARPRFSYFKRNEAALALYSDIYRALLGLSVKRARHVVVQTRWLRDAMIRHHRADPSKISVCAPEVRLPIAVGNVKTDPGTFFYPATPFVYKNLELVQQAVVLLKATGRYPRVHLTIDGNENRYARFFKNLIRDTGCDGSFVLRGRIPREEVLEMYKRSTLLFASRVESFGLPLMEARALGALIVASDMPFCHEVLDGYTKVLFFPVANPKLLAQCMSQAMAASEEGISAKLKSDPASHRRHEGPLGWRAVVELAIRARR